MMKRLPFTIAIYSRRPQRLRHFVNYFSTTAKSASGNSDIQIHHHSAVQRSYSDKEQEIASVQRRTREAYFAGRYPEALDLACQCRDLAHSHFGDSHAVYAGTITNIALMYKNMGREEEAIESYQQALEIYKKAVGEEHSSFATTLFNLGALYRAAAQQSKGMNRMQVLHQALDCFTESEKIRTKLLDAQHPDLALTRSNMGITHWHLKEPEKALDLLQDAKVALEQKCGNKNVLTAIAMNNLAIAYKELQRFDEAIALYVQVVETRKSLLGLSHTETIMAMNNLAEAYRASGNEKRALEIQNEILEIFEKQNTADES